MRRRGSRGRRSPAGTAWILVSVSLISVITPISLILLIASFIMSRWWSSVIILVSFLIVPITFVTVSVFIISIALPVPRIPMVIIITLVAMPWGTIIVSFILVITSLIVSRWRPSVIILVPFIITIPIVSITR